AIVTATDNPAWATDLVFGDHFIFGTSGIAAPGGYPIAQVPAGLVFGVPLGISFIGTAFSEPTTCRRSRRRCPSTTSRAPRCASRRGARSRRRSRRRDRPCRGTCRSGVLARNLLQEPPLLLVDLNETGEEIGGADVASLGGDLGILVH